jgi:hypothetical protein
MGGACSTYVRDEKHTKFWLENLTERDNSGDVHVAGRVILNGSYRNGSGVCDWIHVTTIQWRAIVNMVMNIRVP